MKSKKITKKNFLPLSGSVLGPTPVYADKFNDLVDDVADNDEDIVTVTSDDTVQLTAADSGDTYILSKADGIAFTLPSPVIGLKYTFNVLTSVTSNAYSVSGFTTSDLFCGGITMVDDTTAEAIPLFKPDVSDDDVMSMNGTTTGGKIGTAFTVKCVAANRWWVDGMLAGSGVLATPFA